MNWLNWTAKGSNIEKGCPHAPTKPPKPTEEPNFEGFQGVGVAAFSINKGSGGPIIEKGHGAPPPKPPKPAPPFPGYPTSLGCPECGVAFDTSAGRARHQIYECPKADYLRLAEQASANYRAEHPEQPERRAPLPCCPHCASYALYRNNQGDYECMSCGLQQISQAAARRNHE